MDIAVQRINTKDYLTRSNLPASDYVINPYVGCTHACKYCYARFMKRFTAHREEWGKFIDVKECEKPIDIKRLKGKSVFMSSVTDCYNPYEEKYGITRKTVERLVDADCQLTIATKSTLILRDIELLKKISNLKVAFSINTLNDAFRADMDKGSSIQDRIHAITRLHQAGIHTVLFMSPIFPYITEWKDIILSYIDRNYPDLKEKYAAIYLKKDNTYWSELADLLKTYCDALGLDYVNYFYHKKLVGEKLKDQEFLD